MVAVGDERGFACSYELRNLVDTVMLPRAGFTDSMLSARPTLTKNYWYWQDDCSLALPQQRREDSQEDEIETSECVTRVRDWVL